MTSVYFGESVDADHNYIKALRWLQSRRRIDLSEVGGVHTLMVSHDRDCWLHDGHSCNCYPDISLDGERLAYPRSILQK